MPSYEKGTSKLKVISACSQKLRYGSIVDAVNGNI